MQSSLFEAILLRQKTGKYKYTNDINEIRNKININSDEMKNEMIAKFDESGIKYDIDPQGGITYTIRH